MVGEFGVPQRRVNGILRRKWLLEPVLDVFESFALRLGLCCTQFYGSILRELFATTLAANGRKHRVRTHSRA
jgi:hypothetical protein